MDVLIINLNFAIDKTAIVNSLNKGNIHRFDNVLTLAGGKGVNVARALKTLGISSTLMGFTGGYNGIWIEQSLLQNGFKYIAIRHNCGESRICYSVVDKNGISTDFNEEGPKITKKFQEKFLEKFRKIVPRFKMVLVSGRTVKGIRKGFYKTLLSATKNSKAIVVFDTSGWSLIEGINAGCDIVKINRHEFEEVSSLKFTKGNLLNLKNGYDS
jgi:fructose-1-phosphate kinase PfkB-like protein